MNVGVDNVARAQLNDLCALTLLRCGRGEIGKPLGLQPYLKLLDREQYYAPARSSFVFHAKSVLQ